MRNTNLSAYGLEQLADACNAVDAIHKSLEDEYAEMRTFVDRLSDAADKREDVDLWDTNYTALPLDADGVPIHIGDVMENLREDLEPKLHYRFKVYGIQYRDYGQVCALTEDGYPSTLYRANECRHYHAPTVADVLREFADGIKNQNADFTELAIAEYAKRLQLAEDDAE